jgi:hypothetical protein
MSELDEISDRFKDDLVRIGLEGIGKVADWVDSEDYPKEKLRSDYVRAVAAMLAVSFGVTCSKNRRRVSPESVMELILMAIDLGAYAATHDVLGNQNQNTDIPHVFKDFLEKKEKNG